MLKQPAFPGLRDAIKTKVTRRELFGHVKTRYRGPTKNRAQLFTLFAPGNLCVVRWRLVP